MRIGIVGLGLIGGSIARALKANTAHTVIGFDRDENTLLDALSLGAIDSVGSTSLLENADVVYVCLYPADVVRFVEENAPHFKEGCIVTDVCGIKNQVCGKLTEIAKNYPFVYVGGHPMAGREFSGFRYAKDDLFDRASMILTPPRDAGPEVRTWLKDFFLTIGFRRVQFTTPREHDEMIAYTSQLAHVVSSAYVKCPLAQKHRGFSAGSFADMTRVAKLNEDMWTELFFDNRDALLPEINGLIDRLAAYRDALAAEDHQAMKQLLREGREIKEALEE